VEPEVDDIAAASGMPAGSWAFATVAAISHSPGAHRHARAATLGRYSGSVRG
jgi:hypothetical protein